MQPGKESIPLFGSHNTPESSNYLPCGSVRLFVDDPATLTEYVAACETQSDLLLYQQRFEQSEMGRIRYADLRIRTTPEGKSTLESLIEHTHPIKSPLYFSHMFTVRLLRQLSMPSMAVSSVFTNRFVDSFMLELPRGQIHAETIKQAGGGALTDRVSRRNSLRLLTPIDEATDPDHLIDTLKVWGAAVDILSTSLLHQRKPMLREGVSIDLRALTSSDDKLDSFLQLERYDHEAQAIAGEFTVPRIDFEALDFQALASEFAGDHDMLSAALASCALRGVRVYGKTGIVPPITTQSLTDAAHRIRQSADY